MSDAHPRDASGYAAPFDQGFTVEVIPGRRFECQYVPLTDQLVLGHVPNELYRWCHFEDFTPQAMKRAADGSLVAKSDFELSQEQKRAWENYARLAARAMVWPKLDIKSRDGDPERGVLALRHLRFTELYEIAWTAVREVLPPPESFPVGRPDTDDAQPGASGGSMESGAGAQSSAVPATADDAPAADPSADR